MGRTLHLVHRFAFRSLCGLSKLNQYAVYPKLTASCRPAWDNFQDTKRYSNSSPPFAAFLLSEIENCIPDGLCDEKHSISSTTSPLRDSVDITNYNVHLEIDKNFGLSAPLKSALISGPFVPYYDLPKS